MTSKEKTIVISHKTAREIIEYENANQDVFTEKQMKELRDYFTAQENQPTLDDAIKVVEERLNKEYTQIDAATGQVERSYYRSRSGALFEVLTALKGLKEWKE